MDLQLIHLSEPAETREFEKGRFAVYHVGPLTVGRATYEPGWRWSEHVAAEGGSALCMVEHVGLVIEGRAAVLMDDGREVVMKAGDFFYIPPGHDSWVVGDEAYVSLHLLGTDRYAITPEREPATQL
jgi:quercetin dioxygenase-like cupin family protein